MKEEQKNIQEELEALSPLLSKMKKSGRAGGFEVPPSYFRDLPDQVLEKIRKQSRPVKSTPPWWQAIGDALSHLIQPRLAVGLATAAVLIVGGLLILNPIDGTSDTDHLFSELTAEEVDTYIQSNLYEFQEEMVIEAAGSVRELSLLPADALDGEDLGDEYYEELLRDLDEESIEELL